MWTDSSTIITPATCFRWVLTEGKTNHISPITFFKKVFVCDFFNFPDKKLTQISVRLWEISGLWTATASDQGLITSSHPRSVDKSVIITSICAIYCILNRYLEGAFSFKLMGLCQIVWKHFLVISAETGKDRQKNLSVSVVFKTL